MVQFETIKSEEMKFGNNNFIEVARKKAVSETGENIFISISRGFVNFKGEKKYKSSIALPVDENLVTFVAENLKKI